MQFFARLDADGHTVREILELADGKTIGVDLYSAEIAAECIGCDAAVTVGMIYDPAEEIFSAAPVVPRGLADLARDLVAAGTVACSLLTQQIIPDETHRTAYTNAATIVWGNGGQAPTTGAAAGAFAAQAAALGLSVATFASVVQAVSLVSLQLGAALSSLRGAVASAAVASDLAGALATFEAAQTAIVAALNGAGLTVTVEAPAPILIVGINA